MSVATVLKVYFPSSLGSSIFAFAEMDLSLLTFSSNVSDSSSSPSSLMLMEASPERLSLAFAVREGRELYHPCEFGFDERDTSSAGAIASIVIEEPSSVCAMSVSADLFPNLSTATSLTSCASISVSSSGRAMLYVYSPSVTLLNTGSYVVVLSSFVLTRYTLPRPTPFSVIFALTRMSAFSLLYIPCVFTCVLGLAALVDTSPILGAPSSITTVSLLIGLEQLSPVYT